MSVLYNISSDGVVPLFRYWVVNYLQNEWEHEQLDGWNDIKIRLEYLKTKVAQFGSKRTFDLVNIHHDIKDKIMNELVSMRFITLVDLQGNKQHFLCDFTVANRVVVMDVKTFECVEYINTVWIKNLLGFLLDRVNRPANRVLMSDNPVHNVSKMVIW